MSLSLVNDINNRINYDYNYWADKPKATLQAYLTSTAFTTEDIGEILKAERIKQGLSTAISATGGRNATLDFDKVMEIRIKTAYESLVLARTSGNYLTTQYWCQALEYYLQIRSVIKNNCNSIITRMLDEYYTDTQNNLSVIYIQGKSSSGYINLRVRNYEKLSTYQN